MSSKPLSPQRTPVSPHSADLQAAAALMLDSLVNLSLLATILERFGFPRDVIYRHMLPGSALAVLVGNAALAWLARQLARREGRSDVTALPLGLDTPSTIGMAISVLGPAFLSGQGQALARGLSTEAAAHEAAMQAWHMGCALMLMMACIKCACAFVGDTIAKRFPTAALQGSLAGIGLMLLLFLPLLEVMKTPLVGLCTWTLVLMTLVARQPLPYNAPAAGTAVLIGTVLYYTVGPLNMAGFGDFAWPTAHLGLSLPDSFPLSVDAFVAALAYLPVAMPFALLTVVGGINNVVSARYAGDQYKTRDVLLIDAASTLCAALAGGVAQSTPYIGHAAYKSMGARLYYGAWTGLLVGGGALVGGVGFAVAALPLAAIAPVMMFVGLEIASQAFRISPRRHTAAVLLAFLPTIANLLLIRSEALLAHIEETFRAAPNICSETLAEAERLLTLAATTFHLDLLRMLGHGFLLTAMFWGALLAHMIDGALRRAAATLIGLSALTLIGAVHSPLASGAMFSPFSAPSERVWAIACGYAGAAVLLLVCALIRTLQGDPAAATDEAPQKRA